MPFPFVQLGAELLDQYFAPEGDRDSCLRPRPDHD